MKYKVGDRVKVRQDLNPCSPSESSIWNLFYEDDYCSKGE